MVTSARWLCAFSVLVACPFVASSSAAAAGPEDSTVRIIALVRYPDPLKPWARRDPVEVAGTGVIIDGKRILTNAHLVRYASEVSVQGRPGTDKIEAKVEGMGTDVDLAVLTLRDDTFFKKRPALTRAKALPKVQDNVVVYGFPVGGDELSVTKGVVSRVSYTLYTGLRYGVVIQVSAAVNPGNSGGPATVDGKMVGVVYSRYTGAENIGFIIPCDEVEHFLDHLKDGHSELKPVEAAATTYQQLENDALRRSLQLDRSVKGVLVHLPTRRDPDSPFHESDILTKMGDHEIDNTGLVRLEDDVLVPFMAAIPKLARDGSVPVTILRGGQSIQAKMPITRQDNRLIRPYQGEMPSYFIHGPLVFSAAHADAIATYGDLNPDLYTSNNPMTTRRFDRVAFPGEELVVVTSPMFAHKIGKGYSDPVGRVVKEINGVKIKNLRHLMETIRDCNDDYLTFRFADTLSENLVFDRKGMDNATEEILEDNGIAPKRRASADLLKVWKGDR